MVNRTILRAKFLLVRARLELILLTNLLVTVVSYFCSLGLRFDFDSSELFRIDRLALPLAILLVLRTGFYIYFRLNQGYWRHVSTHELVELTKAHFASSSCFALLILALRIPSYPRSVFAIEFAVSLLLAGGVRFAVRLWCERHLPKSLLFGSLEDREVVILGAGDSGHVLVKNLLAHRKFSYRPVLILDDSPRLWGTSVHGIPVTGSLSELHAVLETNKRVTAVIVAIPSFSTVRLRDLEQTCRRFEVPLKRVQSFEDLACLDAASIQTSLSIEAMLEKEVLVDHEEQIRSALTGKRVLITGAGGSIGSEIARQVISFQPRSVTLLDHSEVNLYHIEREIKGSCPCVETRFVLGSICNQERLSQLFREIMPEVVFHAAAYKHVPLIEDNPHEAFINNVCGTRNLLAVSATSGVKRFVLISTDKAVDPSSIMGCSKRLTELLVQHAQQLRGSSPVGTSLSTAIVRFGNVINSAGSVIPLFREQILSGGPVTVTHPEMERYFMSIREAVRLVLTAGTLGENGEIYILDMGQPIKIVDVARKMLALYGRREIEIIFTGLRPGEKLNETLVGEKETIAGTSFRKVRRVQTSSSWDESILTWVDRLEGELPTLTNAEIATLLRNAAHEVPGFMPTDWRSRQDRTVGFDA